MTQPRLPLRGRPDRPGPDVTSAAPAPEPSRSPRSGSRQIDVDSLRTVLSGYLVGALLAGALGYITVGTTARFVALLLALHLTVLLVDHHRRRTP